MKRLSRLAFSMFLVLTALFLTGCAQTKKTQQPPQADQKASQYSGFLGDYSMLSETRDERGDVVMRYVNPKMQPGTYQAILLEPTRFYPEPQPTSQVDASTLASIQRYVDTNLRNSLGSKVRLVSQPGPGVLRVRPAITAVGGDKAKLKPYQYIPVAFVITEAKGRKQTAALQMEVDVNDSMTGERMGAAVRRGEGAELQGRGAKLSLEDVRPLLDKWIDTGSKFISQAVR